MAQDRTSRPVQSSDKGRFRPQPGPIQVSSPLSADRAFPNVRYVRFYELPFIWYIWASAAARQRCRASSSCPRRA